MQKLTQMYDFIPFSSPGSVALSSYIVDTTVGRDSPLWASAFREFADSVRIVVAANPGLLEVLRQLEKEEVLIILDVEWENEHGEKRKNKVHRCHYNTVLGQPRGLIRFHPRMNADLVRALAFEQTIQNALLNMPMGGCATGSDFDALNSSDYDVESFCHAMVRALRVELPDDWPIDISGDMGCRQRECKLLKRALEGLINPRTRKPYPFIISRPSATGLGAVEFAKRMLNIPSFDKSSCLISGAGGSALSIARALIAEGAKVMTLSDSTGFVYAPQGLRYTEWQRIADHKGNRLPLRDIVAEDGWLKNLSWHSGSVWRAKLKGVSYAFPSAFEHEIDVYEADNLVNVTRPKAIIEVSHLTCTPEAFEILENSKIKVTPSLATNAGAAVALGINMAESVGGAEFEHRLKTFMHFIFDQCKALYDQHSPNLTIRDAMCLCAFTRLGVAMRESDLI